MRPQPVRYENPDPTCDRHRWRKPDLRSCFRAYQPPKGETVSNLLSKGIINADGTPGPVRLGETIRGNPGWPAKFSMTPTSKKVYKTLPPVLTGGTATVADDSNPPPFATLAAAKAFEENALPPGDLPLL